jgi:hypothetical protein
MSTSITRGAIVGMATKEIDREGTARTAVGCGQVGETALEVDGDKIPSRAKGTLGEISDEEHSVGTGNDGVIEEGRRGG